MKLLSLHPAKTRDAHALILVLIFATISLLALTGALSWTSTSSRLNDRNNEYFATMAAAEAATEKVLAAVSRDYRIWGEQDVYPKINSYRTLAPTTNESSLWKGYTFTDAQNNVGKTYVSRIQTETYVPLESQYQGLYGFASTYRIVSNARRVGTDYNLTVGVQQDIQLCAIPVFQFAIFYNGLLEFTWAAPMTVRGRVHCNNSIYTGAQEPLTFHDDVTSVGINQKVPWWNFNLSDYTGTVTYLPGADKDTNSNSVTLPVGTNSSPAAVHAIIEEPPSGEDVNSALGQERYYNKAELVLIIENSSTNARVKTPYASTYSTIPSGQLKRFLNTSPTMYDQREGKTMKLTEINVGEFTSWAATNTTLVNHLGSGHPPNVLYVADKRSVTSSQKTGIRLINGQTLPSRGLTVATPDPLYVKGHFNCPNSSHLGTANTSATKPASLITDGLTLLSSAWSDSLASGDFKDRDAVNTTVNAAILTGNVPSAGSGGNSPRSGGVQNLPRLLEDWGNGARTLTINGSMVNLFPSTKATGPFQWPGNYYYAPTRNFNFDSNYTDQAKLPPGTPRLRTIIKSKWVNPPPGNVTYAGQ